VDYKYEKCVAKCEFPMQFVVSPSKQFGTNPSPKATAIIAATVPFCRLLSAFDLCLPSVGHCQKLGGNFGANVGQFIVHFLLIHFINLANPFALLLLCIRLGANRAAANISEALKWKGEFNVEVAGRSNWEKTKCGISCQKELEN
jgi:hypothetical protein